MVPMWKGPFEGEVPMLLVVVGSLRFRLLEQYTDDVLGRIRGFYLPT